MSDPNPDKPKIIVDDDWKSQVAAEKEQLQQDEEQTPQPPEAEAEAGQIPPASFPMLVSTLASQAVSALGQVPDPIDGKPVVRLDLAKHLIDTLIVLDEKTKGNLDAEEAGMLTNVIHQLRMAYIAVGNAAQPTDEPPSESSIELP